MIILQNWQLHWQYDYFTRQASEVAEWNVLLIALKLYCLGASRSLAEVLSLIELYCTLLLKGSLWSSIVFLINTLPKGGMYKELHTPRTERFAMYNISLIQSLVSRHVFIRNFY